MKREWDFSRASGVSWWLYYTEREEERKMIKTVGELGMTSKSDMEVIVDTLNEGERRIAEKEAENRKKPADKGVQVGKGSSKVRSGGRTRRKEVLGK